MISVTVTDIQAVRRYRDREDVPLHALLRQLKREDEPTERMKAGTALHKILETAGPCELEEAEADGIRFRFELEAQLQIQPIRELRGQRICVIDGEPIEVRARCDSFNGLLVEDHKFTNRVDPDALADSYQWRFYLWIFGGMMFRYNVFVAGDPRVTDDGPVYLIRDAYTLPLWRYPELEMDVESELRRYLEFHRAFWTEIREYRDRGKTQTTHWDGCAESHPECREAKESK